MRERIVKFIFSQIADAIRYLHEDAKLANRDIKPDNILFTTMEGGTNNGKPDRAQLTDFTTVFRLNKDDPHATRINDRSGTMCFWAPEMFTE